MSTLQLARPVPPIRAAPRRPTVPGAYLLLTTSGPILVVTLLEAADHPRLREELARRGFDSYLAWRVPYAEVRRAYGGDVEEMVGNLDPERPLRVVDFDGRRVFRRLHLSRLEDPLVCPKPGA